GGSSCCAPRPPCGVDPPQSPPGPPPPPRPTPAASRCRSVGVIRAGSSHDPSALGASTRGHVLRPRSLAEPGSIAACSAVTCFPAIAGPASASAPPPQPEPGS